MGRKREPVERYFAYRHESGSTHFKRYFDKKDIDEMVSSDLVKAVVELTREQWLKYTTQRTPEQEVAFVLSDQTEDPRSIPGGIIRRLK